MGYRKSVPDGTKNVLGVNTIRNVLSQLKGFCSVIKMKGEIVKTHGGWKQNSS